jgi:hypothetical protein
MPTQGRIFAKRGEAVIGAGVALKLGDSISPAHGLIRMTPTKTAMPMLRTAVSTTP